MAATKLWLVLRSHNSWNPEVKCPEGLPASFDRGRTSLRMATLDVTHLTKEKSA